MSVLETKKNERQHAREAQEAREKQAQMTGKRVQAVEIQMAALCQMLQKLLGAMHTVLPRQMSQVNYVTIKMKLQLTIVLYPWLIA